MMLIVACGAGSFVMGALFVVALLSYPGSAVLCDDLYGADLPRDGGCGDRVDGVGRESGALSGAGGG